MVKTIEQMQQERRRLDRQIKAAKRLETKRLKEQLLSERQALGVWLSESVGADTVEAVQLLKAALDKDQVRQHLARQISTRHPDGSGGTAGHPTAESSDNSEDQPEPHGSA